MKINDGNVIQKKFYKVLSDYNVFGKNTDGEVNAGSKEFVSGMLKMLKGDMVDAGLSGEELEARRDIVDLKAQLQDSSSYFWTYLVTQVLPGRSRVPQVLSGSRVHLLPPVRRPDDQQSCPGPGVWPGPHPPLPPLRLPL